jgi:hypothetical protein
MFQIQVLEKIKTHFTFNDFCSHDCAIYEIMSKNMVEPERTQTNGACALYPISKQAHATARAATQKYVTLTAFHGNNGVVNQPHCYVTGILSLLCGSKVDEA